MPDRVIDSNDAPRIAAGMIGTAEMQYNWAARIVDHLVALAAGEPSMAKDVEYGRRMLRDPDLYLLAADKEEAALEFVKADGIAFEKLAETVDGIILADTGSCVLIDTVRRHEDGRWAAGAAVWAYDGLGGVWAADALVLFQEVENESRYHLEVSNLTWRMWDVTTKDYRVSISGDAPGLTREMHELRCTDVATHIKTALEELSYLYKPGVTVLKETSTHRVKHLRRKAKKGKLPPTPRAADREVHVVFDPDEVHEILVARHEHTGTHAPPRPHKRRAHQRTYRHPRFKEARGKTVCIDEIDVGVKPGERIELPRKVYHVRSIGGQQ